MAKVDYKAILDEAWQQHLAPRTEDALTVISLFSGCGGSSLGYSMAGFRELLAVEWNDNAVTTFKLNFPDVPVYHGDIAKLSVDECLRLAGIEAGELDVLDGSPPCQGFSTAGKRILDDPRNSLFREFVRLLRGLQPKAFIMENVSGLVKGKMKLVFAEIMRELKASGYKVKCRLMNAMYFQVPQSRQRLIWIGIREDLRIESGHPTATNGLLTAGSALSGCIAKTMDRPLATVAMRIWKDARPGQSGHHLTWTEGKYFNSLKLDPSRPAPTIPKVSPGTGGFMHWKEPRKLAIEEAKRLSAFPDSYKLIGNYDEQWERIGNSVPPLFMRAIALHVQELLRDGN